MLNKDQIIENIRQINRSAQKDWLMVFDTSALRNYLDHLQHTLEPRGGHSVWIRHHGGKAVVTRKPVN